MFHLTKAYDFINHAILPARLNSYGVRCTVKLWLK